MAKEELLGAQVMTAPPNLAAFSNSNLGGFSHLGFEFDVGFEVVLNSEGECAGGIFF